MWNKDDAIKTDYYNGHSHFITERFDRAGNDKLHIQTLAAISPDADCYEDLMKTARLLRIPDNGLAEIFRIAAFNVFAANVDDHNKNFSFFLTSSMRHPN